MLPMPINDTLVFFQKGLQDLENIQEMNNTTRNDNMQGQIRLLNLDLVEYFGGCYSGDNTWRHTGRTLASLPWYKFYAGSSSSGIIDSS